MFAEESTMTKTDDNPAAEHHGGGAAVPLERDRRYRIARKRIRYIWGVVRTRLWWGWRLHALGERSVLRSAQHVKRAKSVSIGSRVLVEDQFIFADLCPEFGDQPKIVIGDDCTLMYRFQVNAAQRVVIGSHVLVASNVLITDVDHVLEPGGTPITRSQKFVAAPVAIGDNCWLGQNVVVLKGVTIGHDSIVGANSVVTRDVAPCSVVAGNPARVIKTLSPATEPRGSHGAP